MPDPQAKEELKEAARDVGELLERIAYGVIAFFATFLILSKGYHVEAHSAAEPAVLNAGIAYYTHAATGRVIRALWRISRVSAVVAACTIQKKPRE